MIKIDLPLFVMLPRKTIADKKWILNLNNYRNTHHRTLNDAKIEYTDIVAKIAPLERTTGRVRLCYTYYHGSRRRVDISNPCSVIDKFACDALTKLGYWSDDNSDVVVEVVYKWGGVDKDNPRCELTIEEM